MNETLAIVLINIGIVILGTGIYAIINLVKKNEKLEDIAIKQNEYIVSITSIIKESDKKLQEIDSRGTFQSDDEIGWFFKQVKEIQDIINEYKIQ